MRTEILTRDYLLANWREYFRTHKYDIENCVKWVARFHEVMEPPDLPAAEEMSEELLEVRRRCVDMAHSGCPIGFVKPSWEQAQVLNAWSPAFDPDIAPKGYRSVCNFSANRTLKTAASIFDTLLWILPNDPDWRIFERFEDEEGRKHGNDRGSYQVLLRPDWDIWRRTGKMVYNKEEPPKSACDIWHGVQDDNHWNRKVGKEYLTWMPPSMVGRRSDGGSAIFKQERMLQTRFGHTISGKTYNSDIQAWAGDAVWRINADEGFEFWLFNEMMLRLKGGGYFHWAYTAAEPRNIGGRAKLAYDCYKGKHDLVGQAKFFTKFELAYVPDWAMDPDKKADDVRRLSNEGSEGKIRLTGGFFESSPVVFSNFERSRNVLPIDGPEVLVAIRGERPERWVKEFGSVRADRLCFSFHDANIIRGMDEGLANPTACVWMAILRTGEYVAFRDWEESGLSVGERCERIVDLSGNTRELMNPGVMEERQKFKEKQTPGTGMRVRRTFADSKLFKRNPESPQDDWCETYWKNGLKIERAGNIGPAARVDSSNEMFRAEPTRQHLMDSSSGSRLYVTRNCLKLIDRIENLLWGQISTGQRSGDYTEKPETRDNHTTDAFGYCCICKLKWHDQTALPMAPSVQYDALTGYIHR